MKAVILAGGLGSRMGELGQKVPKVLFRVGGRSLLEHLLWGLSKCGVEEVFLCASHLHERVTDELSRLPPLIPRIYLVRDDPPRGTAGAVTGIAGLLQEDFLVLYGDVLACMDFVSLFEHHRHAGAAATLTVHPNDHPMDSDLVEINARGDIIAMSPKHLRPAGRYYSNLVNAAVYALSPQVLDWIPPDRPSDFGRDVFPAILAGGLRLTAYRTAEYVKDIGTPKRLQEVREDWESGLVTRRNGNQARPAVFLDRDGVINRERGPVSRVEDFELLPGVAAGIRRLNRSGHLAVVVSNQAVVARGELDEDGLLEINRKMEWLLGKDGAYVDGAYYCLHHPDKGFPGERTDLKTSCACRKPEIGLVRQAAAELNIDLSQSWIVGDATSDLQMGINAGIKTVLVKPGHAGRDGKFECTADFTAADLPGAVDLILSHSPS